MKILSKSILLGSIALSVGCMNNKPRIVESSQKAAEAIGCSSFKSKVYDSMYDYLDNEQEAPALSDFSSALNSQIDAIALAQKIDNPEAVDQLKQNISELYKVLIEKSS